MTPKDFYRDYQADDNLSPLSEALLSKILTYTPIHCIEFGSGTGKHLKWLQDKGICSHGIDISPINTITAIIKNGAKSVQLGDESILRNCCNYDVVTTVSVLDHIENIDGIIQEFKRIANKAIVIAETLNQPAAFYYPHAYESYGFVKTGFRWKSDGDGATYFIWVWEKMEEKCHIDWLQDRQDTITAINTKL